MHRQTKECRRLLATTELERGKEGSSPRATKQSTALPMPSFQTSGLQKWDRQLCRVQPPVVLAALENYYPRGLSFRSTDSVPVGRVSCSLPSALSYPQGSASLHSEKYSSSNPSPPLRQLSKGVSDYKPTVRLKLEWRWINSNSRAAATQSVLEDAQPAAPADQSSTLTIWMFHGTCLQSTPGRNLESQPPLPCVKRTETRSLSISNKTGTTLSPAAFRGTSSLSHPNSPGAERRETGWWMKQAATYGHVCAQISRALRFNCSKSLEKDTHYKYRGDHLSGKKRTFVFDFQ